MSNEHWTAAEYWASKAKYWVVQQNIVMAACKTWTELYEDWQLPTW